jgi:DNA-directed RNA polymerase subunit omega
MLNVDLRGAMGRHTSRYSMVTAIARRAREIVNEAEENHHVVDGKPVTLAINDLLDGKYAVLEPEEIRDI